jgi:hypothetical protein
MAVQVVEVGLPQPVALAVQAARVEQVPRVVVAVVVQETALEAHQPPESLAVCILAQLGQLDHRPQ